MIRLVTLFSGSKGNSTLIMSDKTNILIDAGLQYKRLVSQLATLQLTPDDIDAILISHEHSDHVGALAKWGAINSTPIYAHMDIATLLGNKMSCNIIPFVGQFAVKDIVVTPLECSHDALCCYGYMLTVGSVSVATLTDTGTVEEDTICQLQQCRSVLLESNHDTDMLAKGRYSYMLKKRILSSRGHLSNRQASQVITRLIEGKVVNIVLGHLSENNNTHELAFASALEAINSCNRVEGRDVHLYVAEQYIRGEIIE